MRASTLVPLILALAGATSFAQQTNLAGAHLERGRAISTDGAKLLDSLVTEASAQPNSGVLVKKHIQARGPLVQLFQGRKALEFPGRVLHLVNPFAKTAPKPESEDTRELSARAWTTVVGWNPGASAFPDPLTHESSLGLLSLSRSK